MKTINENLYPKSVEPANVSTSFLTLKIGKPRLLPFVSFSGLKNRKRIEEMKQKAAEQLAVGAVDNSCYILSK